MPSSWQYLPRLGMLFYILSRFGRIRWGLACCSISWNALAVSAEVWHAILYLITPWQYQARLGMLLFYVLSRLGSVSRGLECFFYLLSRLGSICRRTNLQKPKLRKPKFKKIELRKLKLNKQTHAGLQEWEVPCGYAEEVVDFASGRGYSKGQRCKFAKTFLPKTACTGFDSLLHRIRFCFAQDSILL